MTDHHDDAIHEDPPGDGAALDADHHGHLLDPGEGTDPVVYEEPLFEAAEDDGDWLPDPDDMAPWPSAEGTAPAEPTGPEPDAIWLVADGAPLVAGPLDDLGAFDDDAVDTSHAGGPGDGPIDLSGDPGGLHGAEPVPPGLIEEPSWDLVPEDNGAVGAAAMGLAAAAAVPGGVTPAGLADLGHAADAPRAVALLEDLGAPARLEHGGLHDLRECLDGGGTVLLTGTDGGGGRVPLALVAIDDERGMVVLRAAEGPPASLEVSVAAFQQAWDDTAAQMVVAGAGDRTLLLPVTVPSGPTP